MMKNYPKMKTIFANKAALFNFTYPHATVYSYDTIETMLYNHFKNYRIAAENDEDDIEEWQDDFAARMNEIMPRFNKLFDTWDTITNPLRTVDVHQDMAVQRDIADTGTASNIGANGNTRTDNLNQRDDYIEEGNASHANSEYQNGNVEAEKKFSDMPQGDVSNIDDGYLTNYTKDGQASNNSSVGSANDQNHKEFTNVRANTGTVSEQGTNSNTLTNNLKRDDDSDADIDRLGYEGQAVAELLDKYRRGIDDYNSQLINAVSDFFVMIYE